MPSNDRMVMYERQIRQVGDLNIEMLREQRFRILQRLSIESKLATDHSRRFIALRLRTRIRGSSEDS